MISLVITTYNGSGFLREQLDSIFSQTLVPDEIIAIDDCSTDDTFSILMDYRERYGVKVCRNDSNLGYNKNFQKGISLTSGDYICLCDQDDVWMPNKIERSFLKLREIEDDGPACVSSNCFVVDNGLNKLSDSPLFSEKDSVYEEALCYYSFQGCSLMFNKKLKDLLFPFPDDFNFDIYIGIYSIFSGSRYCIGQPLMYYRQHESNAIGVKAGQLNDPLAMGSQLHLLIRTQTRKRLLCYIRDNKYIVNCKKDLLNRYINLFSYNLVFTVIIQILLFPYYSIFSKFSAIFLTIKWKMKDLLHCI